jgi:hypothetical protein
VTEAEQHRAFQFHKDRRERIADDKRNEAREDHHTLQWLLVHDITYREAREAAQAAVLSVANRAAAMLQRALEAAEANDTALDQLMARAAMLPDGRKVFRTETGAVVDENGQAVDDDLAATVLWPEDAPDYAALKALQDQGAELDGVISNLRGIEVQIGGLQDALDNDDPAADVDDLRDIKTEANDIDRRLDDIETVLSSEVKFEGASPIKTNELAVNPAFPTLN